MTITIMTIVLRLLCELLLNIEVLLEQNYSHHSKKQRTFLIILNDRRLIQTRVITAPIARMSFNMISDQVADGCGCIIIDRINIL